MKPGLYVGPVLAGCLLLLGGTTGGIAGKAHADMSPPAHTIASSVASSPTGASEQVAGGETVGVRGLSPRWPPRLPGWHFLPGEFAMRTLKGYYVTAIDGGGRVTDPVLVTGATTAGPWEKYRVGVLNPPPAHDKSLQTSNGHYLTAIDGGGRITDVIHTDATQIRAWERFRLDDLSEGGLAPTYFAIQTIGGNLLTAVGEGGQYTQAIHSNATQLGRWEYLRLVKCGNLGSGYQYTIIAADDYALSAVNGGGQGQGKDDTITLGRALEEPPSRPWARFRFIRQPDGSYALQTYNGINYVTALGGGGQVQNYLPPSCGFPGACISGFSTIFHTDATQVRGWERFRFIDQGNCTYAIQTVSGYYVGIYKDSHGYTLLTTDRSRVSANEIFQLVMYGLASPPVLH